MSAIFFWKQWPAPIRRIWHLSIAIAIGALGFMWFSWFQGNDGIIHWEKIQEQKTVETTIHSFRVGPFELSVPAESYVIFEYLQGSDVEHNASASFIFLGLLLAGAAIIVSVISTLDRFWYLSGMTVFILFVVSLRLDLMQLFGQNGVLVPAVVLIIFLAVSFYFNAIRTTASFVSRLLVFGALMVALVLMVEFAGQIPFPLLHLATAGYTAGLVLSILFILMVAHEIMASLVYVTTRGTSKNLRHFLIISTVYLANVLITLLHEIGTINWDFLYLNLYLLLTISAILGLWGFRMRENLYDNIVGFAPLGALFFVALAIISFATIGQLLGNANDPALKVIRDLIIFTHFAFGLALIIYIFSNFIAMMAGNMPVYKVLYRPNRMPYFTFRLAGVIITLAFVFASYWQDYVYYSMAGFYNYAADLYKLQENETLARAFYDRSRINAFENHRANYALAMIKASRLDFEGADESYELANERNPSDYSLVNQGNLYLWRREYFPAIGAFRQARMKSPSAALDNNLGFAYASIHHLDSATYLFFEARRDGIAKTSAEANFFGMTAAELIPVKTDSILRQFDDTSPGVVSNALVNSTLFRQELNLERDPLDVRELNLHSATLLNNYIVYHARDLDTTFTSRALKIAEDSLNVSFREALKASLAHAYYHQGNIYMAKQTIGELFLLTQSYQGKYNYLQGLWALEQGNPDIAVTYFAYALQDEYKKALLYYAIALTEAQRIGEARVAWDSVATSGDSDEIRLASQVRKILSSSPQEALTMPEAEKYQYARYMVSASDTVFFSRLINSLDNPNYKVRMLLEMCYKQLRADRMQMAIRYYNQIAGLEFTDQQLLEDVRHFQLLLLAIGNEGRELERRIDDVSFRHSQSLERMLYNAVISLSKNDTVTAERNYAILGLWNPYFEEGVLAAASFFREKDERSPKAYDILAEAIQSNPNSVRLLEAYITEATRQGLVDYARDAALQLEAVRNR